MGYAHVLSQLKILQAVSLFLSVKGITSRSSFFSTFLIKFAFSNRYHIKNSQAFVGSVFTSQILYPSLVSAVKPGQSDIQSQFFSKSI